MSARLNRALVRSIKEEIDDEDVEVDLAPRGSSFTAADFFAGIDERELFDGELKISIAPQVVDDADEHP